MLHLCLPWTNGFVFVIVFGPLLLLGLFICCLLRELVVTPRLIALFRLTRCSPGMAAAKPGAPPLLFLKKVRLGRWLVGLYVYSEPKISCGVLFPAIGRMNIKNCSANSSSILCCYLFQKSQNFESVILITISLFMCQDEYENETENESFRSF